MAGSDYATEVGRTFLIDLARPEDAVFAGMNPRVRSYVRRAIRTGLTIEESSDVAFADEFYLQLQDVFAHQGLVPTYSLERVRALIAILSPTHEVSLLSVRTPDGECVASSIVVGRKRRATLWGAAFYRSRGDLHPNEFLHWETIRYWLGRGMAIYDMGGGGEYKVKYGGVEVPSVHVHRSRLAVMRYGRSAVRALVRTRQIAAGRSKGPRGTPA